MSHWMALIPGANPPSPCIESSPTLNARSLGWWCLQFTPRVALLDEGVVAELQASHRLFGGAAPLAQRIQTEAQALGCRASAQARTAAAALALARHHGHHTLPAAWGTADADTALVALLDALPLQALYGVAPHAHTLARLGCRTLKDVRTLPRGGLSRRFGASMLQALDEATGARAQAFDWLLLPPVFESRLELPYRVESAQAMGAGAALLLDQLCAWLAGQHAAIQAWTLHWQHDFFRPREAGTHGSCTVRLASPSRDRRRLQQLMNEHLQRIQLGGPVGEISLHAEDICPLADDSRSLFPEISGEALSTRPDALSTPAAQKMQQVGLHSLMERLSARLGPDRVLQGQIQPDHRPEEAQTWYPSPHGLPPAYPPQPAMPLDLPQPCWLLKTPQPLMLSRIGASSVQIPVYQGRLRLLAGPHRIEAGWWDQTPTARDYYLASSPRAGLLWIYRDRHPGSPDDDGWFLHGLFA